MLTVLKWAGGAIGLVGILVVVLQYLRRAEANAAQLGERDAALDLEHQRLVQTERAAAEERARRRKDLDARIASVRTADDAAGLLRDVTHADDGPTDN